MKPHEPFDRNGKPIKVGDLVRIVGVPDLSGMSPEGIAESLPAFAYLVGKYKRVRGFDEYGCAEFSFVMHQRSGERGRHTVGIEPFLLHVPQSRSNPAVKTNAP
jgi:hypothetical protein